MVPRALLNVSLKFGLHSGLGGGAAGKRVSRMKRLGHKSAPKRRKRSFLRPMRLDSNRQTSTGSLLHAGGKRPPPGRRRLTARLTRRRDIRNAGLFVNVGLELIDILVWRFERAKVFELTELSLR